MGSHPTGRQNQEDEGATDMEINTIGLGGHAPTADPPKEGTHSDPEQLPEDKKEVYNLDSLDSRDDLKLGKAEEPRRPPAEGQRKPAEAEADNLPKEGAPPVEELAPE
ncbi:hypothetical protein COLO4_10374 [Corchorus olitorius]|uniref:Uncharacterized protein n=1 Tax=Corchorus olitorius TaxID=93759 RepID=A0A1R3K8W7_9ROSI|nr:hypothetical protein COLO4_10374 [Corchorus olitorius]